MRAISRDTTLCMSLAARSGQFGTRFHNHLYAALGLDYVYKTFTTTDLPAPIAGIRALGILYTGVRPDAAQVAAAAAYARGG